MQVILRFYKIIPLVLVSIISGLWLIPNSANAQLCTTLGGQGTTYCPPPTTGTTQSAPNIQDGSLWEARWGAITTDNSKGVFGTADGHTSKRAASKAAMDDCKKWGGTSCKIAITYTNQCGVLVSGSSFSNTARGPNVDKALSVVIDDCKKRDPTCKLFHAGCSYAQKVR